VASDYRHGDAGFHPTDIFNRVLNASGDAWACEVSGSNLTVSAEITNSVIPISAYNTIPISAQVTLPVSAANTLSGFIVNTLSANIYNALSAQITNTLSANIYNALTAEISNAVSASITNTLTAQISNAVSASITNALTAEISNAVSAAITNTPFQVHPVGSNFVTSAECSMGGANINSPLVATSGSASGLIMPTGILSVLLYTDAPIRISEASGFTGYFLLPSGITYPVDCLSLSNLFIRADDANSNVYFMIYT
jgi:hypothetical protein